MKKLSLLWLSAAVVGAMFLTSCGGDDEVDPVVVSKDSCETAVFPTATGSSTIKILNFTETTLNVQAGSPLILALEITKGIERAQKVRLFASTCDKLLGTEVDLSDQPKGGPKGIDLRRTDEAQVRNVIYNVPASGFSKIYLTIEVDEKDNKFTYKKLTLNVSGSGVVDTYSNVELGGNSNALASRMSSGTGETYLACNAAANIEYIDITYAVNITDLEMYLCSNPARFETPVSLGNSEAVCGEDGTISTKGGKASYFKKVAAADYDAATSASITALTVANTDKQYVVAKEGEYYAFLNSDNKKGVIKVESINLPNKTNGSITVSVKVQR